MAHKRFFVEKITSETIISGEEYSHAKNVLRVNVGDEIVLLDNSGKEYDAVINSIGKNQIVCRIISEKVGDKESKTQVTLLCGALKGDKTELIVQKATELGVSEIFVFNSKFCSAYMNENKIERLNKVAKEASKQCLRSKAPTVSYFDKFENALNCAKDRENKIFACEFAEKSDIDLKTLCGSCALVVGSEGGFSQEEFELAQNLGYNGVTLGKRILRAETAAITLTSIVMFSLGEMQ